MAGYVKVWTFMRHNPQFKALRGIARGAFLQLLLECKAANDTGVITIRQMSELAEILAYDKRTCDKIVANLCEVCLIHVRPMSCGSFEIIIPNYQKWQELTLEKAVQVERAKRRIPKEISLSRAEQSIYIASTSDAMDQPDVLNESGQPISDTSPVKRKPSGPKKERPPKPPSDHKQFVEFWVDLYESERHVKYDFSGARDGQIIKSLLQTFALDLLKRMARMFLEADNQWLDEHGRDLRMFKAFSNRLALRAQEALDREEYEQRIKENEEQELPPLPEFSGSQKG